MVIERKSNEAVVCQSSIDIVDGKFDLICKEKNVICLLINPALVESDIVVTVICLHLH